ncbi:unnamed protein product [Ectocarpus sp. 4 AP-2014]
MDSFSSGVGGGAGGVFIGSFNINSEDLTVDAARAWLKQAEGADIVALGLQECGTVPANPFPEPINGKAIAMWQHVKDVAVPEARVECANLAGWGSPGMAGVAQAAVAAKLASAHKAKRAQAGATYTGVTKAPPACGSGSDAGQGREEDDFFAEPPSSGPVLLGGSSEGSTGMRQESYYLRGVIDEGRDNKMLATIADCIPGRQLVADVAMGETPTHGKIKVNISRNLSPKTPPRGVSASSAAIEAAMAASANQESSGEGWDTAGCDGPLDESGRPEWSAGDVGAGGINTHHNGSGSADPANGAVFKTVEWYGTIRLLVFVRKDLYKNLGVKTVVIPAGDKPSVVADAPEDYAKDTSPDKGAVACYLEDPSSESPLQLALVNCHLYGTNKYGVKEAVFDKYRMAQLRAIDLALQGTIPTAATAPLVLFGDLNFRAEMLSGTEDKAKGGNDFQAVREMAEECDPRVLLDLYNRADRLRPLLDGEKGGCRDSPFAKGHGGETGSATGDDERASLEDAAMPWLLTGLRDGLGQSLAEGHAVRPTFTYKPKDASSTPRRYNDKRTPSWTDRILWRGFEDDERLDAHPQQEGSPRGQPVSGAGRAINSTFAAVQEVIASDHEPVFCVLGLPREIVAHKRA